MNSAIYRKNCNSPSIANGERGTSDAVAYASTTKRANSTDLIITRSKTSNKKSRKTPGAKATKKKAKKTTCKKKKLTKKQAAHVIQAIVRKNLIKKDENPPVANKVLEDVSYLETNKMSKAILQKVEDMLIDYRNTSEANMMTDQDLFLKNTSVILNDHPSEKTNAMYKRYQDMWVSYTEKNGIKKDGMSKDLCHTQLLLV